MLCCGSMRCWECMLMGIASPLLSGTTAAAERCSPGPAVGVGGLGVRVKTVRVSRAA
jgi:hypothetical protein